MICNCLVIAKPRPKADRGAACKRQVFKFHITSPRQPVEGSARGLWVICLSSMNFERFKRRESADERWHEVGLSARGCPWSPRGDVLLYRPCLKFGCVGLSPLGCLGVSHSRVVTENTSSPKVEEREPKRAQSQGYIIFHTEDRLEEGQRKKGKKKRAVLIIAWCN